MALWKESHSWLPILRCSVIPRLGPSAPSRTKGASCFAGATLPLPLGIRTRARRCETTPTQGGPFRHPLETPGGTQEARFVTEGELYRLIASSKLPAAQAFEVWVFDDVLPWIRRHGVYAIDDLL